MGYFIHTGLHRPTATTVDDPELQVYETDDGHSWMLKFYVNDALIDAINLDYCRGKELNANVLNLPVINVDGEVRQTVKEVIKEAIELMEVTTQTTDGYIKSL